MRTPITLLAILVGTALMAGCNDSGNSTTIINQGLDCFLFRNDLVGDWTIDMTSASSNLQNCTGSALGNENRSIVIDDFPRNYPGMDVFGSDGSTSFKFSADRAGGGDPAVSAEVTGTVQADSCLALVRVWDEDEALYVQCIGTFSITNGTLSGACDSVEIDSDANGQLDTSCSLDSNLDIYANIN